MPCACIDIGSNTTRLLLAERSDGVLRELLSQRVFTQIGKSLEPAGTIPAAKIAETASVVASQARMAREGGARRIEAVATAAIRKAANRGDLAAAIEQLRRPPRRRGLAVVISDFLGEPDWERALRALSARHELLAVEVLDPRELDLPDVGTVVLADPETGRQREVLTTPLLRREFAAAAAEHRDRVAAVLRRCGAAQLTLRTDSDWIADVVRFALARKRAWSGGGR